MIESEEMVVRGNLVIPPFEVWLAGAAVYTGAAYFLPFLPATGNSKVIDATLPALVAVWSTLYALGGIGVLAGLWRRSPRIEGAGISLLGSGLTVAALASLQAGSSLLATLVISGGLVAACIWRMAQLRRLP